MNLIKDFVRDLTSLGSLPIILIIITGFYLIGRNHLAKGLIISILVSQFLIYIIRIVYFRPRPGNKKRKYKNIYERLDESSFPSIHASRAGIIPMIISQNLGTYPTYFLWVLGLGICFSRLYLKRHHPTDVFVGFILGVCISYIILTVI